MLTIRFGVVHNMHGGCGSVDLFTSSSRSGLGLIDRLPPKLIFELTTTD